MYPYRHSNTQGQPKSEDGSKDGCWNFIACWIRGHRLTKLTFLVHLGEIGWQIYGWWLLYHDRVKMLAPCSAPLWRRVEFVTQYQAVGI